MSLLPIVLIIFAGSLFEHAAGPSIERALRAPSAPISQSLAQAQGQMFAGAQQ